MEGWPREWLGSSQIRCNWATKGAGTSDEKQASDSKSVAELTNGSSEDVKEPVNGDAQPTTAVYVGGLAPEERKLQQLSMDIYRDDKSIQAVQTFGVQIQFGIENHKQNRNHNFGRGGTTSSGNGTSTTVSWWKPVTQVGGRNALRVYAAAGDGEGKQKAPPGVDTRIH
nr:nucleotide-binding, alpha-beta plait [Tanacetum cinerariifolium]